MGGLLPVRADHRLQHPVQHAREHRGAFLECEHLENFVRGAVAVGDDRLADARAAVGLGPDVEELEGQVAEINTTVTKQFAVVRHLSKHVGAVAGDGLEEHAARLHASYRWACALVHVTPLLLLWSDAASQQQPVDQLEFTIATSVISAVTLLNHLAFHDRFGTVEFAPMLAAETGSVSSTANVQIPAIEMLQAKNKKLAFQVGSGDTILVYDPNGRQ